MAGIIVDLEEMQSIANMFESILAELERMEHCEDLNDYIPTKAGYEQDVYYCLEMCRGIMERGQRI